MFTDKAQEMIDLAKDYAFSSGSVELTPKAMLVAMGSQAEAGVLLAESLGMTPEKLRAACPEAPPPAACPGKLPLQEAFRSMLATAKELAEQVPDRLHPGMMDLRHLVCAMAMSREIAGLLNVTPLAHENAATLLAAWYTQDTDTLSLEELTARLRGLRADLLTKVFGQDHAVHAFVEGLFNAEVVAAADKRRKSPRAVFVFAGPPGVGKTYLAELGASALERPFKRYDMSAFSGHHQNEQLVGMSKSYHGSHPGTLTEFVEKNPSAILLFDEIEKAHTNTILLFLQILDAGSLEDKHHERNVSFRNTTIIFTTNAGRKLYDRPNVSGVNKANATFHRKTILDALETETNPQTREPFFPAAICSRLATGYPVLFNHLRINELNHVARAELTRIASLFERQYFKRMAYHEILPMTLVLREGARVDARTLRSQTETFVKTEIFKFCQLFKTERLEDVLDQVDRIEFSLDGTPESLPAEVKALFQTQELPHVLLIANPDLAALYKTAIPGVEWLTANTSEEAMETLADADVDLVLLDLWVGNQSTGETKGKDHFDHVPAASRSLDKGQELLKKLHDRLPGIPVFLLSLAEPNGEPATQGSVDEELFMACVRGGGARGMVVSRFRNTTTEAWETCRDQFAESLAETCRRLYREKAAERMGQERKVLSFDTVPHIDRTERVITILLRNLTLTRAIAAADAGEVLDDVERPRTRFDDVIGADSAKEEMSFFIDFLKNPRRFSALGLKAPKGILLHGPPGTGKTMLARAMAGESNVAFIPVSATNFVTMWQGSGPQNIRDLFARARRYAPSIVFIDEIDAIGKMRSGTPGSGQGEEMALNALLTEMDGFLGSSPDRPVFVLAATNFRIEPEEDSPQQNRSRMLDPALVRRFSRPILVDLPDRPARCKYLTRRLHEAKRHKVTEATIALLAEKSAGMSIANLEQVIEAASRNALKKNSELDDNLLIDAMDTLRFGEVKEWSKDLLEGTAFHEAGHTIMYWLCGWIASEVTIISRSNYGGYMAHAEDEVRQELMTREEKLAQIRVCLGGRAAEVIRYGKEGGKSTGASSDLQKATASTRQMICSYGMEDEFGVLATPELLNYPEAFGSPAYQRVNELASRILNEQMQITLGLLQANLPHLETVSKALLEKNRLSGKELASLLPPPPPRNTRKAV